MPVHTSYSKPELKKKLTEAYAVKGAPLSTADLGKGNPYGLPSYATIVKHFGTWPAAAKAIKMPTAARGGPRPTKKPMAAPGTARRMSANGDASTEVAAINLSIKVLERERDKLKRS